MNVLNGLYYKSIAENEKNLEFWETYLQNLKSLNFEVFADKLKVPALIPIGSRIFFRGELRHTNDVTVALGADYFTKCSLKQAEVLRQHRIKDAELKINTYKKEKEFFENQLMFKNQNLNETEGQEIIEHYTEEEERVWREKHIENVRKYKQKKDNTLEPSNKDMTDEELWYRLEELELQEELQNELEKMNAKEKKSHKSNDNSFIVREDENFIFTDEDNNANLLKKEEYINEEEIKENEVSFLNTNKSPKRISKQDLLQQVLIKQSELEQQLLELKNKERAPSKTEKDLISKLDEMDELDEFEDEMDRLDDILQNEDVEKVEETNNSTSISKLQKGVSFADEDDSETLELTFKHTDVEPCKEPYDHKKGILKPSDIYTAFSDLFTETKSILKKTKYESDVKVPHIVRKINVDQTTEIENAPVVNKTVIIKDVIEKEQNITNKLEISARPTSLFKKKRLQSKQQTN